MVYKFKTKEEISSFMAEEVIDTTEAMKILQCSEEKIDNLIANENLKPIRKLTSTKIFFKADILARVNRQPQELDREKQSPEEREKNDKYLNKLIAGWRKEGYSDLQIQEFIKFIP